MGKPTICICENSNCEADQRLCFRYTDSTVPLRFKILALFYDCTGRFVSDLVENHIVGFPARRLIIIIVPFHLKGRQKVLIYF